MNLIKMIHVLAVFIWMGNLLALTRLMGYHVKQEPEMQKRLALIYRRMVNFIGLPFMILAIFCGLLLLSNVNLTYRPAWFHMKLTFLIGLVIADICVMRQVSKLNEMVDKSKGVRFRVLHGIVGLLLIGILCSVYVVRDRRGELLVELQRDQLWQQEALLGKKSSDW